MPVLALFNAHTWDMGRANGHSTEQRVVGVAARHGAAGATGAFAALVEQAQAKPDLAPDPFAAVLGLGRGTKAEHKSPLYCCRVDSPDGSVEWHLGSAEGPLHREGDQPAVERANGNREWWLNGQRHRDDGPAIEEAWSGDREWYVRGLRHRVDGPAVEWKISDYEYGTEWWLDGKRHRAGGEPAVETANDDYGYTNEWWVDGVRHRKDGPAVEEQDDISGIMKVEWWLDGQQQPDPT